MDARGLFEEFLGSLEARRARALEELGPEKAFHMLDVHGCVLLRLRECLVAEYEASELARRLLFSELTTSLSCLLWAQLALLVANYPAAFRELRYVMELACRARLVDQLYPMAPLEHKIAKALELERKRRGVVPTGWRLVKKALEGLQSFELNRDERLRVRRTWLMLNRYAHPSPAGPIHEASDLMWQLDEELALELLRASDVVFDVLFLLVLDAFPRIRARAADTLLPRGWDDHLWMTYRFLRSL